MIAVLIAGAVGMLVSLAGTRALISFFHRLGKGHENTQTIGTETFPFNDAQVARELLGAQS